MEPNLLPGRRQRDLTREPARTREAESRLEGAGLRERREPDLDVDGTAATHALAAAALGQGQPCDPHGVEQRGRLAVLAGDGGDVEDDEPPRGEELERHGRSSVAETRGAGAAKRRRAGASEARRAGEGSRARRTQPRARPLVLCARKPWLLARSSGRRERGPVECGKSGARAELAAVERGDSGARAELAESAASQAGERRLGRARLGAWTAEKKEGPVLANGPF